LKVRNTFGKEKKDKIGFWRINECG